jgi:hypothetical protein
MSLMVEAVLKPEWAEFFFSESAVKATLNLVSKLGNPLIYQRLVNMVVFIHSLHIV